jgi:hypothetical protein
MAVGLLALVVAGCGELPSRSADIDRDPTVPCMNEPGEPLDEATVIQALRDHGIDLHRESTAGMCSAQDVVVGLTNAPGWSSDADVAEYERIVREDGHVICALRRHQIYDDSLRTTRQQEMGHGLKVRLANLEYTIYRDEDAAESQLARLRAGFSDLERALAGPSDL